MILSEIKRGPRGDDTGRKISKAIGGSFSKRIADDPQLANQPLQPTSGWGASGKFGMAVKAARG